MERGYIELIAGLKRSIVDSRYAAAKLVNKEQLLLYFKVGKMLSEKIAAEEWGAKVMERIADDLQQQLPGLRGFSHRNLVNSQFYEEYREITQSVTAEIRKVRRGSVLALDPVEHFWAISFTHHMLVLDRCKATEERF